MKSLSSSTTPLPRSNASLLKGIGNDPGSVNYAICKAEFRGFSRNEKDGSIFPLVKPVNWELWNLKKQNLIRYTPNPAEEGDLRFKNVKYGHQESHNNEEDMIFLNQSLNAVIRESDWIFEPYNTSSLFDYKAVLPFLATEIQCGHVKDENGRDERRKLDILLLSRLLPSSISMADHYRKFEDFLDENEAEYDNVNKDRLITHKLLKYGIPNDNALTYTGRKLESIKVTKELLVLMKDKEALKFLDDVERSGQKIDDLCDAFLLTVQALVDLYQSLVKKIYIDHSRFKRNKYEIEKECPLCRKTFTKEVLIIPTEKSLKRKERCVECKEKYPPKTKKVEEGEDKPFFTKKQRGGGGDKPFFTKKNMKKKKDKGDDNKNSIVEKKGRKSTKRKRDENDDNEEKEKPTKKTRKQSKEDIAKTLKPIKKRTLTIDLTETHPIFPKHSNEDDSVVDSFHASKEEEEEGECSISIENGDKKGCNSSLMTTKLVNTSSKSRLVPLIIEKC